MPNLFQGEYIRLTAMRPEDASVVTRWYEDSEFGRLYDASTAYPRSETSVVRLVEDRRGDYFFAIRTLYSDALIGLIDIGGIEQSNRVGWLALAIGDPANRGRGYGSDALRLMLRFAFHEVNLHRVQLTVFAYNTPAIRLYEKFGFTREGVFRDYILRDGQRHDMFLYGLLAHEWAAHQK